MAEEETEISELEFRENLSGDDLIPVETATNTFATSLIVLKDWFLNYLVGKTGDETIGGVKTFLNKIHIPTPASNAENSEGANVEYVNGKILDVSPKTGVVQAYAGITPPEGWLFCDGSAISRTTYAELFAIIGTTYGGGDGSTTFNLPNLSGVLGISAPVTVFGNGKGLELVAKSYDDSTTYGLNMIGTRARSDNIESQAHCYLGVGSFDGQVNVGTAVNRADIKNDAVVGLADNNIYGGTGIVGTAILNTASQHAAAIIKY